MSNNFNIDDEQSSSSKPESQIATQEFIGLFFLLLGILIFVSIYSYAPSDPTLNTSLPQNAVIKNNAGLFGAYFAGLLVDFFGIGSYVWSFLCIALGGGLIMKSVCVAWWRILGCVIFCTSLISLSSAWALNIQEVKGGGIFGHYLYSQALVYFSPVGSSIVCLFSLILSAQLVLGISWLALIQKVLKFFAKKEEVQDKKDSYNNDDYSSKNDTYDDDDDYYSSYKDKDEDKYDSKYDNEDDKDYSDNYSKDYSDDKEEEKPKKKYFFSHWFSGWFSKDKKQEISDFKLEEPKKESSNKSYDDGDKDDYYDDDDYDSDYDNDYDDDYDDDNYKDKSSDDDYDNYNNDYDFDYDNDDYNYSKSSSSSSYNYDYDDDDEYKEKKSKKVRKPRKKKKVIFKLPSAKLLSITEDTDILPDEYDLDEKGDKLISALADYNIEAELVRSTPGPVITMYEIHPAPNVRVNKISALADDLAMKLKAISVRIQAPIPGSDTVGIEVPNDERANVSFRELIEGNAFKNSSSLLTMALGKSISGSSVAADLAKMPHLLVAGATGAGKSVCLNSIIVSLIYKATPNELKLLLIDPKRIELATYEDLPHLVHPVVTEMDLAKNALLWAIDEMNKRFELLKDLKVRNILSYNEKVASMPKTPLGETLQKTSDDDDEEKYHEKLPYIVIIIDELADLIMTHGKDVENSIVRLAQLARAAGIHMILATQRPSVDVVTGLIKANFPCRISFQVTQKVDSRTILDATGAETLLGKGDMLFKSGGGKLQRLHGAFVPDEDVTDVVEFWKAQQTPDYKIDFTVYGENSTNSSSGEFSGRDISQDPAYEKAIELLPTLEKVTISGLQRKLRLGFNKAALIKEQLERDGYIQER